MAVGNGNGWLLRGVLVAVVAAGIIGVFGFREAIGRHDERLKAVEDELERRAQMVETVTELKTKLEYASKRTDDVLKGQEQVLAELSKINEHLRKR